MSSSVMVKFYLNGKKQIGKAIEINKLKNLLIGSYFCDELENIINEKVKDAGEYWINEFIGYLHVDEDIGIPAINGEIKLPKDFAGKILFPENPTAAEIRAGKYNRVYGWGKRTQDGKWYSSDSFYKARLAFEKQLEEEKRNFFILKKNKESIDYYKLNPEQQSNLSEDLSWKKEVLKELEEKIYICQYMIDLFNDVSQLFEENWNDYVIGFIYIC